MKSFLWLLLSLAPLQADVAKQWQGEIQPILETYCFDCHADGVKKGDFSFGLFLAYYSLNQHAMKSIFQFLAIPLLLLSIS
jgi:hypothetical protein